jgi:creatinine amidohydrolase
VTSDTGVGDPSRSSAEKGARYVDAVAAKIGEFLVELASADLEKLYE